MPVKLMEKGYRIGEQVTRISNYRLHGWSYVDEKNLIMQGGVRDYYLVSLRNDCRDMQSAMTIGFSSTVGALTDRDKVIVRGAGGYVNTCFIEALHRLEKIEKEEESG